MVGRQGIPGLTDLVVVVVQCWHWVRFQPGARFSSITVHFVKPRTDVADRWAVGQAIEIAVWNRYQHENCWCLPWGRQPSAKKRSPYETENPWKIAALCVKRHGNEIKVYNLINHFSYDLILGCPMAFCLWMIDSLATVPSSSNISVGQSSNRHAIYPRSLLCPALPSCGPQSADHESGGKSEQAGVAIVRYQAEDPLLELEASCHWRWSCVSYSWSLVWWSQCPESCRSSGCVWRLNVLGFIRWIEKW